MNGAFRVPQPVNEPIQVVRAGLAGEEVAQGQARRAARPPRSRSRSSSAARRSAPAGWARASCPHDHGHVLARYHKAGKAEVERAIDAAREARKRVVARLPWDDRAAIFLKAADLLAGPWRDTLNAATMLGQRKTVVPGRDRRGLRGDRLLALQPLLRAGRSTQNQPISSPGDVEPHRVPRRSRGSSSR